MGRPGKDGALRIDLPSGAVSRSAVRLLRPSLERILGLTEMARICSGQPTGSGASEWIDWILGRLDVRVEVDPSDLRRIPDDGPVIVVANHPFGGIEGLILGKLLLARRGDSKILANYLLGRLTELRDLFLLVDPFGRPESVSRNLAALRQSMRWLKDGHLLAAFPAGEVSLFNPRTGRVEDPRWLETVEGLVRHTRCPVVPVYFPGRNSLTFQLLGSIHPTLRTAMLGRELLKRRGAAVEVRVGFPIAWRQLAGHSGQDELTAYLRSRTYILGERPSLSAGAMQPRVTPRKALPLAPSPAKALLLDEIERLPAEQRIVDAGSEVVYVATAHEIPNLLREIGRQRERTFREVGEGTGREIDLDVFDASYSHLFVWNRDDRELVGSYRIGRTDELLGDRGLEGLYTSTLFSYRRRLFDAMGPALEMGRSFIRPEYQKSFSGLMLLWKGIGRLVTRDPDHATLFGPVSISADYNTASQRLIIAFLKQNRFAHEWSHWVRPRTPTRSGLARGFRLSPDQLRDLNDVSSFISEIEADHKGVPILLKQYLKLGGRLLGFNVDPEFSNVLDVLIMVDLRRTEPKTLARYMGREGAEQFLAHHRSVGTHTQAG